MSKIDKQNKEEYLRLEEQYNEIKKNNVRNLKEKEGKLQTAEFLKVNQNKLFQKEIKAKQAEIIAKSKELFELDKKPPEIVKQKNINPKIYRDAEIIQENCEKLNENYYLCHYEQSKLNNQPMDSEKNLKINYLIVKKLDLREEFLLKEKIVFSNE